MTLTGPTTVHDQTFNAAGYIITGGILAVRKIGTNCIQTISGVNTYSGDTTLR